jgi:hypothetical protein
MEAAVAALEEAAKRTAGAASAAKEAAMAASNVAREAAGVAAAAKEAAAAALATAKQAAAASSTAKEAAVAADTAAKKSEADAAAAAKDLAAAKSYCKKRRFHQIDDGGRVGGNRDGRGDLDLIYASPTRSSEASSPFCAKEPAAAAAATTKEPAAAAATTTKTPAAAAAATTKTPAAAAAATTKAPATAAAATTKALAAAAAAATKAPAAAAAATTKEPAAAMRHSKKPRFHQIDDGGRGGGERDDGGNLDFISALPDEVLRTIISLLSTKDGARTQAISRRWLPLWRSAPLNLVVKFQHCIKNRKLIASVSKILSEHRGHARRLWLELFNPTDIPVRGGERKIDGWLRSQALDSLQELDFTYMNIDMPLSVFRFAPTLRFARFSYCSFPESISALRLNFPCLKRLTLDEVTITEDGLHSMLSGCTVLESLKLTEICGVAGLCISSQTLRSLAFSACRKSEGVIFQLVIEDAPSLERLLPLYRFNGQATIQVIRAPKLEILGKLSEDILKVQFGTTIFQVSAPSIPSLICFLIRRLLFLFIPFFPAENGCCQLNYQNSHCEGSGS